MSRTRDVPGGGRAVEVAPERVAGWFERFADRHGGISLTVFENDYVTVTAGDGSVATVDVPYGPLTATDMPGFVAHLCRPRRVGLLLVRLGGHSVGIATSGRVEIARSGRKPVHGRNSAGGWSQQRFARRREGQARQALRAAARDAYEVLVPRLSEVDSVVLGGDQHALAVLRTDPRLAGIFAKAGARVLDVGEPRRATLDEAAERARAVEIVVHETP